MSHNNQKKIAAINDISGFGKCSISAAMPVMSYLGVQCCFVPTSIFSNHTGFKEYFFDDYTKKMQMYIDMWKKLDLRFEAITTGFLGSKEQIDIVQKFIKDFREENTIVLVDPAMGENGKPYPTYTKEMCMEMKKLVEYADIITPNVTEACMLTDTAYKEVFSEDEMFLLVQKLIDCGAKKVVMSGARMGENIGNVVATKDGIRKLIKHEKTGEYRSGTGDIYSAIIAADAVNGVEFTKSVEKAAQFVKDAITITERMNIPGTDGLAFEEILYKLKRD